MLYMTVKQMVSHLKDTIEKMGINFLKKKIDNSEILFVWPFLLELRVVKSELSFNAFIIRFGQTVLHSSFVSGLKRCELYYFLIN